MVSYFEPSFNFPRLASEYKDVQNNSIPYINVKVRNFSNFWDFANKLAFKPDPEDMSQCYYCIRGPQDSVYEDGYYIGKLVLSRDHPYKPPAIYMMTPSGRFAPEKSIWWVFEYPIMIKSSENY